MKPEVMTVIDVQVVGDRMVVVVQLHGGDVAAGMRLTSDTGFESEVIGIGFVPAGAWEQRKRAITLRPVIPGLAVGAMLHVET